MAWVFFAITSVVTDSISNLFRRLLMKDDKSDPYAFAIIFQFGLALITGLFAWYKGLILLPPSSLLPNMLFLSVLYGFGTLLYFKAAQKIDASEISILMVTGSVVSVILGVILLKESFGIFKLFGVSLILLSVFILNFGKQIKVNIGFFYAIGAAVCYAVAGVNDAFVLRSFPAIAYLPICSLLPGIFLLILKPNIYKKTREVFKPHNSFWHIVLLCIFYGIQGLMYFIALEKKAPISLMGPIGKSAIILTVILATIFLNERKNLLKKMISTGLVTVGVLFLIS